MKWQLKEPCFGDMIRVKFSGVLYHYGVYVSDSEVIQFGLIPTQRVGKKESEVEVLISDIDTFLGGGFLEVAEFDKKEKKKNPKPQVAVECARSKIGMRGYNLLYNNCEHFATECVTGVRSSSQADGVRAMFKAVPILNVYFAEIPDTADIQDVYPPMRDSEIKSVSNERVRREKYFAWRLLEYALERSLGLKINKIKFAKEKSGRWTSPSAEFSISHGGSLVAVAVSRASVGVDVEPIAVPRSDRFWERILTEEEKGEYLNLSDCERNEYLIGKWTAKEAVFKRGGKDSFVPSKIPTASHSVKTERLTIGDEEYFYSVASDCLDKIKIFKVDLNEKTSKKNK